MCGALSLYADETNVFQEREVALLDEVAMDISFGLDRMEEEAQRAVEALLAQQTPERQQVVVVRPHRVVRLQDVTQRRRAEDELTRHRNQLEQLVADGLVNLRRKGSRLLWRITVWRCRRS